MKYMLSFYYGHAGRCVVYVPHPVNATADQDYMDEDDTLIRAAIELGMDIFYPYGEVLDRFLEDDGYTLDDFINNEEVEDEFWHYVDDWELQYINGLDGFIQYTGMTIKPVPPNFKVGIIEQNKNPLFHHYQGLKA